jgi:hypothetical protein
MAEHGIVEALGLRDIVSADGEMADHGSLLQSVRGSEQIKNALASST